MVMLLHFFRNQQTSCNEVLPWPKQDKFLGKYVKNAVKEIKVINFFIKDLLHMCSSQIVTSYKIVCTCVCTVQSLSNVNICISGVVLHN